jgi:hypothetical protein
MAVAAMIAPTCTELYIVCPCGKNPKVRPIAVAVVPTRTTSRQAANVATRNGAEASRPM